jgi:hypothetical protein
MRRQEKPDSLWAALLGQWRLNLRALLRIRDVYPGSRILSFTHPESRIQKQQQKGEVKIFFFIILPFVVTNFTKFNIILFLKCWRKKFGPIFQRIIEVFTQKIFTILSNIWVWVPGSETRDPEKTHSRSRIQGSKRYRIPDPDQQHW